MTTPVAAPFSLKATVLSHGWHECAPMSWSAGGRCFQMIERIRDRAVRVSVVEAVRRRQTVTLRVTAEGNGLDDADLAALRDRVRLVLGLDRDLAEFYDLCRRHPTLHVIPRIGAGRTLRSASMTENVLKAICATNVAWTQAVKSINRLGQLGPPVPRFVNLNAWPTPREILRAGKSYLTEVCRVGYRADAILAFCADVGAQRIAPDLLSEQARDNRVTSDELLSRLRAIRGIGPSSAHYLLSMLGRHERLSIDSATVAHVARTHTRGRRPSHKEIEHIYAEYGPWRQLAWWFEHWLTWGTAKTLLREAGIDDLSASQASRANSPAIRDSGRPRVLIPGAAES